MKKKFTVFFYAILLTFFTLGAPMLASAQNEVERGLQNSSIRSLFGGLGGSRSLTGSQTLAELITNLIRLLLLFAGLIAIVVIIYGGYLYITSGGNEERAGSGKKALLNAIIGLVVIGMAYVIVTVVVNLINR